MAHVHPLVFVRIDARPQPPISDYLFAASRDWHWYALDGDNESHECEQTWVVALLCRPSGACLAQTAMTGQEALLEDH